MTIRKSLIAILLTLTIGMLAIVVVSAQQSTPSDDQVNAIAKQLYCPVCENIPLDVCPTPPCARWRELIRQKLQDGWTDQQIKDYFVTQYGARVLGTPPAKGINWLIYVVPPIAILAGVYILYRAYRSWKNPTQPVTAQPSVIEPGSDKLAPPDEYLRKMEEELHKRA